MLSLAVLFVSRCCTMTPATTAQQHSNTNGTAMRSHTREPELLVSFAWFTEAEDDIKPACTGTSSGSTTPSPKGAEDAKMPAVAGVVTSSLPPAGSIAITCADGSLDRPLLPLTWLVAVEGAWVPATRPCGDVTGTGAAMLFPFNAPLPLSTASAVMSSMVAPLHRGDKTGQGTQHTIAVQ